MRLTYNYNWSSKFFRETCLGTEGKEFWLIVTRFDLFLRKFISQSPGVICYSVDLFRTYLQLQLIIEIHPRDLPWNKKKRVQWLIATHFDLFPRKLFSQSSGVIRYSVDLFRIYLKLQLIIDVFSRDMPRNKMKRVLTDRNSFWFVPTWVHLAIVRCDLLLRWYFQDILATTTHHRNSSERLASEQNEKSSVTDSNSLWFVPT